MFDAGRIILDIPPSQGNPRNSEGAFITLPDGRMVFIFSMFRGGDAADHAPASLARIESADGGETWSDVQINLTAEGDGAQNIMSVSLLPMLDGSIGLFYFIRRGYEDSKEHLRRSWDGGLTWSEPVSCVPAQGYYVTNNDRVIRLQSGRLVVPAGFHRSVFDRRTGRQTWDSRCIALYCYSDDDGQTWAESNPCTLNVRSYYAGLQEPGVIELANGSLYGWARTDTGVQYEMFSLDCGESWSVPEPSRFTGPNSPLSMKRNPATGHLIAIWNPIPNYIMRPVTSSVWNGGRTPLVCSVSSDEGKTWSEPVAIEDDPTAGYCYTAMHFNGDDLLLAYCAGGNGDGGCLNRLRIRKLPVGLIDP